MNHGSRRPHHQALVTRALLLADLTLNSSMFVFDGPVFVTVFRVRGNKNSPANQSSRLTKRGLFILRRGGSSFLKRDLFAGVWSCIEPYSLVVCAHHIFETEWTWRRNGSAFPVAGRISTSVNRGLHRKRMSFQNVCGK